MKRNMKTTIKFKHNLTLTVKIGYSPFCASVLFIANGTDRRCKHLNGILVYIYLRAKQSKSEQCQIFSK